LSDHPAGRAEVVAALELILNTSGMRWAWQGPAGAPQRWLGETGPKDLDVWCAEDPHPHVGGLGGARVADARAPDRLRHLSLAFETATGPAVVDLTWGDLRVGPILLVPATQIALDDRRLAGVAAAADLLIRPVLRGRLPDAARLAQARAGWRAAPAHRRRALALALFDQLGQTVTRGLMETLDGMPPSAQLPRQARLRLAARSLAPAALAATWAQRHTIVPASAAATGPLGLRVRGVVVALIGTDGAGKSTVADGLHDRLRQYGLHTGSAYFGMARGNLPGVGLARRTLKVDQPSTAKDLLRRAAAWFYAAEYVWRYLSLVAPQKRRKRVVIVDRWVYDLYESPWPGSPAARAVQRLVPEPDVLVLPDAPIEQIHARKPERPLADQSAQQERYRRLVTGGAARYAEVVVDTSGNAADPLGELVAVVVEAAHPAGHRRR
jgi:thymidylate kinase